MKRLFLSLLCLLHSASWPTQISTQALANAAQPAQTEVTLATRQTYSAGTRSFGPVSVPVGTRTITATFDTSTHTNKAITWDLRTEISRDAGKTWELFVSIGRALGGVPYNGAPAHFSRDINPPADANTQMRGTYTITGGSLQTEIKVVLK